MAHERTELELGPGVTALTGPNNTGKSAIVEALRCVATNPVPKHYIRHGAKEARVTVEVDDGTKVVWIRKKRSSGYELWKPGADEPEEYWKFGRKPPEDILKALRLDLVELETGGEIDVHVGNQREPVFLLNQPSSNAAAFFAASTESAHLLAMQNLLKRQTQDAKRQERDLEGRIREIEGEIDLLAPLPDIAVEVEKARDLEVFAKEMQAVIPALEKVIYEKEILSESVRLKKVSTDILKDVSEPPKLNEVSGLSRSIRHIHSANHKLNMAEKSSESLGPLLPVPPVENAAAIAQLCIDLRATENTLQKANDCRASLESLAPAPSIENTTHLSDTIDQIIAVNCRKERIARWNDVLQNIAEPPVVESDAALARMVADIQAMEGHKERVQSNVSVLEKELQTVMERINQCIDKLGCCPTCGADLNTEAFIDHGCRHDA